MLLKNNFHLCLNNTVWVGYGSGINHSGSATLGCCIFLLAIFSFLKGIPKKFFFVKNKLFLIETIGCESEFKKKILSGLGDTPSKAGPAVPNYIYQNFCFYSGSAGPVPCHPRLRLAGAGCEPSAEAGRVVPGRGAGGILHQQTGRRVHHHQAQGGPGQSVVVERHLR